MTSLVPVALPHGALALALVLPGPVGLLTVLAAVGRVPATPVNGLGLALVTLKQEQVSIIGGLVKSYLFSNNSILKNYQDFRIF